MQRGFVGVHLAGEFVPRRLRKRQRPVVVVPAGFTGFAAAAGRTLQWARAENDVSIAPRAAGRWSVT
jgi:hypothetical protein